MLKSVLLIFLGTVILPSVVSEDQLHCKNINVAFTMCSTETRLLSIDQIRYALSLKLNFTSISTIAPNAFKHLRIVELSLDFSSAPNITRLVTFEESSFTGLSALRKLNISGAEFELSPNPFQQLADLMHLPANETGLNKTKTSIVTDTHQNLERLSPTRGVVGSVSLEGVKIGAKNILSGIFDDLPDLEELDLSWNSIQSIRGKPFTGLNHLMRLKLDNSRIYDLGPGVFDDLTELEYLDLHGNSIDVVRTYVFNALTKLREIDLRSNSIVVIENYAFSGLSLETLRLNSNDVRTVQPSAFNGLNVRFLDLRDNQNMKISSDSFEGLRVWNLTVDRGSIRLGEFK